ncbi:N-acetylneuraminate synthase family protein, partial [Campylobacter sp. 50012-21]
MKKVFIIAEAGVNHNGDINIAKRLIETAAKAGADAVKFQSFKAELVISKNAKKAEYQVQNTGDESESQLEMVKKLELDEKAHDELIAYAKSKNIEFLSTPFDLPSVDLLVKKGLKIIKIPSG